MTIKVRDKEECTCALKSNELKPGHAYKSEYSGRIYVVGGAMSLHLVALNGEAGGGVGEFSDTRFTEVNLDITVS